MPSAYVFNQHILADTDPTEQAEEYDSAYASYTDARKCFNEINPIVALTDGGGAPSASSSLSLMSQDVARARQRKGKARVAPTL